MQKLVAALSVTALIHGCGLLGDDPPRDRDAAADDGDDVVAGGDVGALSGAWPQASIGRPGGVRPELALGWRVADNAAPGTGTGFIAAPCPDACAGTCGIAFEVAEDRRIVDLQVATGDDDEVFLNVVVGPDALHLDDVQGHRSRLLRAVASDDLLGRDELAPDLDDAARRVGLTFDGEVAFLARDLLHLSHPDGPTLLAVGHLFRNQGSGWAVRDVALGLDPLTGRVRFTLRLPAEVFTINRPFEPTYQAFAVRLLSDGRLVILRDGFVETSGRLFVGAIPRDGEDVELTPIALDEEGFPFSVSQLDVDARDRLYTIGQELVSYPLCGADAPARPRTRLRVFAPPHADAASPGSPSAALLHDEGGLARSFEAVTALHVEETAAGDFPRIQVMVSGHAWSKPICADALLDYPKARDQFSADEDDITACPTRLESACGAGAANPGACPCSGCQGLQQICPPSLFGPTSPALVYVETFATGSDVAALSPIRARAFPVPAEGPIVTNGRDRALVAGSALSLLDLGDGVGAIDDPVVWRLPSWDAVGGLAESPVTTLLGGWQSPLFSADGERFVASLLTTQTTGGLLDSGAIERRMTQRGGIVSGTTAPIARTVAREKSAATTLVATGESDRLFPLASGHMLAVFSWRGPAPVITDTPDLARRLELHLLVPADAASGPLRYFQDKDLRPAAGDDIPVLARCDGTRREDLDACAYPLPARVLESDVSVGPDGQPAAPREVSCLERDGQGNLVPGCDVDTLRARWEDTQPDTLASASSGLVTARCEAPSVRRRTATGQGDASVELLVGCPAFGERFHPFAPGALLALDHRPHVDTACQASRGPGPFRAVFSRPAFDVVVSDAHGDPVTEAEVGASLVLSVVVVGVDGGTATYEIVSGAGSLDGAGDAVTVPSGEPVDLEPTAEGVIVVRVTLRDADGSVIGVQEIAIAIDGASGCSGNDDGALMHPCHARLPFPPPQAPGADESRTAPAEAGQGVLLHDRSLRLTEVDLAEAADALPVALSRTYRSAHREDGDGLAGGWHFALDMRLAPVTDGDRSGVADPTWLLDEDLAAGHVFDIAVADGGGRIDTWRHPGTSEVIDTGSGPKWWVWDAAAGRAVAKAFRARVTTYVGPRDSFATLRSYTLLLDDGEAAFERHPYWHADRGFRPNERRFYELSEPNGLRRIFDCKGRLVLVIDAQLREVELVYGGPVHPLTRARRLSAVIDSAGRRWSIDWTVVGAYPRIASITDPFGRRVEYHYLATSQGSVRLAEVRRVAPDADPALAVTKVTRYRYDPTGHLTSVARVVDGKELGRMAVSWDGDRVERQVIGALPDDAETWDFAGGGAEVVVTDGRGTARTYTLAAVAESSEVVVAEAHTRSISDGAPEARREVDAVATTRWTHTPSGLVASMTSPLGRVSTFEYTPEGLPSSETETGPDGSTRTASWRWSDANAQLAPGFRCLALSSMTAVTGALTTYSLPPFDGSAPGRSCQPSEVRMPDGEGLGGQVASRRVRFDYVADGPHRGALAAQTVLEDGVAQATKTLTYPPAAGGPSGFAGKVAEPYIGLPSSVAEDVPRPSQCAPETLTHARTDFTRDGRGNVVRSELVRRTQPLVVTTAWDAADRPVRMVVDPDGLAHATTRRFDDEDRVVEERERVVDDDPSGLLPERAAERELVQRTYYDAAGRRVAFSADGGDAGVVELFRWDPAGGLVASLHPGTGSDDATIGAVRQRLADGESPSALLAELDPRNSGHANYTSQAPPGSPVTPSLDPRWILEVTRLDADGLATVETTTAGAGGEVGCVGCDDMHERTERSSRDLEGRVVVFDPGRTDRGDGATRVLVATRYDGLGRVVASDWLDPEGCDGPGTVVRSETRTALTPDDHPGRVEIHGDSGHGDLCDDHALLAQVDMQWTATGLLRERREQRLAVLPALAPDGGARTTRYAYDHAGRVVSEVTSGNDAGVGQKDETRYALADAACWTGVGPADGAGFDSELARDTDQLGLPAYETELHHGAGADVTVQRSFDYDALGRMLRARDGLFQVRRELAWDSLGRLRAERDVRGAVHESRYDGLGGQVAALTHGADETIATRMTRRAGVVVRETSETRASGGGATTALGDRAWRYDAFARAAVAFPRGEAFPAEAVVSAFGASDEPLVVRSASGITLRHELDAFGHVARATAELPASLADGWQIPAGHAFARTTARTVRRDALGRVTEGATFASDGQRLTHFSRDWDSLSGVLRELQDLDATTGVSQHVDTFARFDDRGRPVRVESDRGRLDPGAVEYAFDHLDRIVEARAPADRVGAQGIWELAHPERIRWAWTGTFVTGRSVVVGSAFDDGLRSTWTSTAAYDELGQRYDVTHAGPVNGTDGGVFYEHRKWFWAGDAVVEKAVMLKDGVEQGDLGPTLAGLALRGRSQLESRPPAALFAPPASPHTFADNAWDSRYEARELDDQGHAVRAVTARYAPYAGALSLSGRWQSYLGGRLESESAMVFDPDKGRAVEVKHADFAWSPDGSRIISAHHLLARKVSTTFGEPAHGDGSLAGVAAEREDRLGFDYGGESQAAHDGCDLGASGEACVGSPRHRFVYDPWGQLEYVAADEPDACRAPGPGGDDVFPVADGLRLVHDALGRRVLERWHLPAGCAGPSALAAERDRSFVYHHDTLVEERILQSEADGGDGVIRHVPGPEGLAWLAVRFGGAHRGHFVAFADADGGLVGFYDVVQKKLVQASASAPWFRPHQMLALDATLAIGVRLATASGLELQPFARLAYVPDSGYALDLHGNPLADRWYATRQASEGFFDSVVQRVLLGLDVVALATAWIPIVGDVIGFAVDLAHISWDLLQDGPSWGLAGRTLAAVGFAAVGLLSDLGGPPAWGAKVALRAKVAARVVKRVDVARGALSLGKQLLEVTADAFRVVHRFDNGAVIVAQQLGRAEKAWISGILGRTFGGVGIYFGHPVTNALLAGMRGGPGLGGFWVHGYGALRRPFIALLSETREVLGHELVHLVHAKNLGRAAYVARSSEHREAVARFVQLAIGVEHRLDTGRHLFEPDFLRTLESGLAGYRQAMSAAQYRQVVSESFGILEETRQLTNTLFYGARLRP